MKYFLTIWKRSIAEWKDVRALSCCGIFAALSIALKFTASIDIGEYIRIGFSDLPGVAVSVLFGPAVGGFFWGVLDILKYIVAPTGPFFPGFTVSAVMNGILFGMVCYPGAVSVSRIFGAELLSKAFVSVGLNTFWLSLLYGGAFVVILPARVLTNLIMLPIDTAMAFIVLRFVERLWRQTIRMDAA